MKKKPEEQKKGAPAYMNTYGDMMTLLLCFFVLLFSMSTVDAEKFQALVTSFNTKVSIFDGGQTIIKDMNILDNGMSQFPVEDIKLSIQEAHKVEEALRKTEKDLKEYINGQQLAEQINVEKKGDALIIRFSDMLLFESGKADIKAGAVPTLGAVGDKIKAYMKQGYYLSIEGHTDNIPINTVQFPSNWYLSSARAISVASFYIEHLGFERSKVSCVGSGEFKPIASNDTAEGRSKNRRVEMKLSFSNTPS